MSAIQAVVAQRSTMRQDWRKPLLLLHVQLLKARKDAGLTQEEVARRLSVSRRNFQRWEDSQAEPSASELFRWAALFGISITSAVEGDCANTGASAAA